MRIKWVEKEIQQGSGPAVETKTELKKFSGIADVQNIGSRGKKVLSPGMLLIVEDFLSFHSEQLYRQAARISFYIRTGAGLVSVGETNQRRKYSGPLENTNSQFLRQVLDNELCSHGAVLLCVNVSEDLSRR